MRELVSSKKHVEKSHAPFISYNPTIRPSHQHHVCSHWYLTTIQCVVSYSSLDNEWEGVPRGFHPSFIAQDEP